MGASTFRIMAFGQRANSGGSHAPTSSYSQQPPGPSVGLALPPGTSPPVRLPAIGHHQNALGGPPGDRRGGQFPPRHLPVARRAPRRGDRPQGGVRLPPGLRGTPAPPQPRLGGAASPVAAPSAATAGDRSDLDSLPRGALPRPQGG